MKKIFSGLVFICLVYQNSNAQFLTASGSGNSVLVETTYTNVIGSPYYYEDWKQGAVIDRDGNLTDNLMIKYDGYRDEVQFLRDGRTYSVEPAKVSEFYFQSLNENGSGLTRLLFKNGFDVPGFTRLNYFQVVYDGSITFLTKTKIKYLEELVSNYGTNEKVKKFEKIKREYVMINGKAIEIEKGRKNLLEVLGSDDLKVFIKQNKLSIKDDSDLVKILSRFDSLKK